MAVPRAIPPINRLRVAGRLTGMMSEDDLIARFFAPLAGEGAFGLLDDAAAIAPPSGCEFVITKDMLVCGGHFFADDPPFNIAQKLMRVNLSDLAAKGATPFGFFLGLALPKGISEDWLAAFAAGLAQDAREFGFVLLGGDTVKGPLTLSLTALGTVPKGKMVRRTGMRAGDKIYVTGTIGDAALGLKLRQNADWRAALAAEAREFLLQRYLVPCPRNSLAAAVQRLASGAMDVSDGFIGDLSKMARVSGVSAQVELARVPLSPAARAVTAMDGSLFEVALTGGDDYELLVAVAREHCAPFEAAAHAAGVAVTCVGAAVAGTQPPVFVDASGMSRRFVQPSYSHF